MRVFIFFLLSLVSAFYSSTIFAENTTNKPSTDSVIKQAAESKGQSTKQTKTLPLSHTTKTTPSHQILADGNQQFARIIQAVF